MAEVLGIIASGVSIASIAIQIVGGVQQILDFWSSIKNAPTDVQDLLEEIQLLANLLLELDDSESDTSASSGQPTATRAAQYCKNAANSIDAVVKDLADGFAISKGRRRWTAVKAVLKEKRMAKSLQRLERAKMMLSLAQQCYTQFVQIKTMERYNRYKFQILEDMLMQSANHARVSAAVQRKTSPSSPTLGRALSATPTRHGQIAEATYWTPLGMVVVRSKTINKDPSDSETEDGYVQYKGIQFRSVSWISQRGFSILSSRAYGRWQHSFRSYRIITMDDPVYAACVAGDLGKVQKLCGEGQATPFDTTSDGWSLLHVAAAFADPALCRWLIDQGLDGTMGGKLEVPDDGLLRVIYALGTTPLAVAADCSGRNSGSIHDPGISIKAIAAGYPTSRNKWNRAAAADPLETLRVLVEHGQSDPTTTNARGESAINSITGKVECFNYLFRQEHFQVDLFHYKHRQLTLPAIYAQRGWINSSTIALICFEQEKLVWKKTFHSGNPPELALANSLAALLHGAVYHLRFSINGDNHLAEVRDVIKNVVANGADIHATFHEFYYIVDAEHLTPLDHVFTLFAIPATPQDAEDFSYYIVASVTRWLRALKDAGVDLKEYVREEERRATLNGMKEAWRVRFNFGYRVSWQIEVSDNQEDYSLSIEYEARRRTEGMEKDRIPGGWIEEDPSMDLPVVDHKVPDWINMENEEENFPGGCFGEDWEYCVLGIDSSVVPPLYTWKWYKQGIEKISSHSNGTTLEGYLPGP